MLRFALVAALWLGISNPRDVAWQQDIAVARQEFLQKDMSFTPERRALASSRLEQLASRVASLTDQQIVAELARVAALADNGHTRAYLLRNRGWWRRYPIRIWKFSDGWHVIAARQEYEHLLGARIIQVSGRSVSDVEASVKPLFGGPDTWATYMAGYTLTSPDALLGTGVIQGGGAVQLQVQHKGKRRSATLLPALEPKRSVPEENW